MNDKHKEHWTSDPEKVEKFILNRINEKEREELVEHLNQCDKCKIVLQQEQCLVSGIKNFGRAELKQRLKSRILTNQVKGFEWTQVISLAAAIILMFGIIFIVRWFSDLDRDNIRPREIVLKSDEPSQRSLWIIGKVTTQQRKFRGTLALKNTSIVLKQGIATQTVFIYQKKYAELPSIKKNVNGSNIQTLLEQNSNGLNLTLFTDTGRDSPAIGVEAPTSDSLIVYLNGQQIAYHIPGGWAEKI